MKLNNQKFSTVKSDYKIILDENSTVIPVDDTDDIQKEIYNIVPIAEIAPLALYTMVDVCGTVLESGEKEEKSTKKGPQLLRKIVIGDSSKAKIELALWRTHAEIEIPTGSNVLIQHVKVGEYNGKNLTSFSIKIKFISSIKKMIDNNNLSELNNINYANNINYNSFKVFLAK